MKKILSIALALALAIPFTFALAFAGNGAPSGAHYNLNIIGVPKEKAASMQDDNLKGQYGHVIFVPLDKNGTLDRTKILLFEGDSFQVLDKNGTDGEASFQLPIADTGVIQSRSTGGSDCTLYNSDGSVDSDGIVDDPGDYYVCGSGETVYSVFARALGKPGGLASVMLCGTDYTDPLNPIEICSIANQLNLDSSARPGKFSNVTANLLYLYNVYIDGVFYKRIPLFSDALQDYLWSYDNNGLKLLQLRFYWCSTIVPVDWPGAIDDSACFASK